MAAPLARTLFAADPKIRYVAVNRRGRITEMEQRAEWSSLNPSETDRLEELVVNPVILEAAARRGNIDLDGVRAVIIRYGLLDQIVLPVADGHVSVGVQQGGDVVGIAERVADILAGVGEDGKALRAVGSVERALRLALPRGVR